MVVFAPQNLIMDPPFTKLDILTCRNLLIYFGPDLQKKLLPLFHYSLKPGGILMLGSAESITGFNDLFETLESKARLFRRNRSIAPTSEVEFPSRHLPPPTESFMDTTPKSAQPNLQNLADQLLLQHFAPAAVLVTASGDLVYINGRTGKYLEPAAGKVNWNIYAMAREGLRQEISLAMPQALRSGETVICRNLQVGTNDGMQTIDLTVYPIKEPGLLNGMAMLVLTDVPAVADLDPSLTETSKKAPSRAKREQELATALTQAKQEIKRLHEEMQTSQEEVKSASEELQSTNEELQSTNEELTTSKEEMQSLNEELQTVNIELQHEKPAQQHRYRYRFS
jgi:two-component system CheB/CheR fusion protein